MFLSTRQAQEQIKEHQENLGSPTVSIDPEYQARIQKAVAIVNQQKPGLLNSITDIIGHLGDSVFGRFNTRNPHTIYINIQKLESELRSRLSGQSEETIQQELDNQIVKTIIHEATHQHEFEERGESTESGPDRAEEEANKFLPPIELKAHYRKIIKGDVINQYNQKDNPIKLQVVLEAHKSPEFPHRQLPKKNIVAVDSVDEASRVARKWITDHDLGSSNVGKIIILFNDSPAAYVSFNGKIWNLNETAYASIVAHIKTGIMIRQAYVRKMGNKWCVLSHKGKKLGCYKSKAQAVKRLRQIEFYKHH